MNHEAFRFVPIAPETADALRRHLSAVPVRAESSPGFPCRQCMQDAAVGDEMMLVAFDPFDGSSPYSGPGPIYLHRAPCTPFAPAQTVPPILEPRRLSVRGFAANHMMQAAVVVEGSELEPAIVSLFEAPEIEYLHVHNAGPGCWNCRVVRSS